MLYPVDVLPLPLHVLTSPYVSGSGALKEIGMGKGKYYSVNVPLQDGIQDESFCDIFQRYG